MDQHGMNGGSGRGQLHPIPQFLYHGCLDGKKGHSGHGHHTNTPPQHGVHGGMTGCCEVPGIQAGSCSDEWGEAPPSTPCHGIHCGGVSVVAMATTLTPLWIPWREEWMEEPHPIHPNNFQPESRYSHLTKSSHGGHHAVVAMATMRCSSAKDVP